jgi:hypothetical protein
MLSVSSYPEDFVDHGRASIDALIAAFDTLAAAADPAATEAFEPTFFNDLVLVLDHHLLHRGRNLEARDGYPLDEVRMLCNSLVENGRAPAPDKTIRMKPESTRRAGDGPTPTAARPPGRRDGSGRERASS